MDFESYLLSKQDIGVSADSLKEMGKQAAMEYSRSGTPLNDTIRKMVKEASLNHEQTKRVVENANIATFHILFKKKDYEKNVNFPVADADQIFQETTPSVEKTASAVAVPSNVQRYVPGQENVSFGDFFGIAEKEKTASASTQKLDHDAAESFRTLKAQEAELNGLHQEWSIKLASLRRTVEAARYEGFAPEVVGAAIENADVKSPGLLPVIGNELGEDVVYGEGVKIAQAGMAIAPQNPITGLTQDLDQIAQKMMMANQALEQTRMAHAQLLSILQGPAPMAPTSDMFQPNPMAPQQPAPAAAPAAPAPEGQPAPAPAGGPQGV